MPVVVIAKNLRIEGRSVSIYVTVMLHNNLNFKGQLALNILRYAKVKRIQKRIYIPQGCNFKF